MKYPSDLILEPSILFTIENKCKCANHLKLQQLLFPAAVDFYLVSPERMVWEGRVYTIFRKEVKAIKVKFYNRSCGIYWPKFLFNYTS